MNKTLALLFFFLSLFSIPTGYADTTGQAAIRHTATPSPSSAPSVNYHIQAPAVDEDYVNLFFFWSRQCPHCLKAKPFVEELARKYDWLVVHSHDIYHNRQNIDLYLLMAKQLGIKASSVPGFIFCGQMMAGFNTRETTGKELEARLSACHENYGSTDKITDSHQDRIVLPFFGEINYQDFSLPVFTLIIATLDAFNPCAFFVLFFLLSLIGHHRNRLRIAVIGGTFVLVSGAMYFLFMAAWLNLFLLTRQLSFITTIAGGLAITIGLINIKDYFFQKGFSLSIPEFARPQLFQRIRNIVLAGRWPTMLLATVVLAIVANSYELLCTAGMPMIYTRVLTANQLSTEQFYLYLAFYNLIYIVPLLLIVAFFTFKLSDKKISEQEGRSLKLLSGNMMLGLGWILFFTPELILDIKASLSVIAGAIGITLSIAAVAHFITREKK